MNYIPLGEVGRPFGIRGEVRVRPYNPYTRWFEETAGVWLREKSGGEPKYYRLLSCRRHQGSFLLSLEGIGDRDSALALRGQEVVAPEEELPSLPEGEYYWFQLVGLKVESENGVVMGEVVRLEETAPALDGNDLLVVASEEGEILIPLCESAIRQIDLSGRKMVVDGVYLPGPKKPRGNKK